MADRASAVTDFLQLAGWARAIRAPLAGDASARRYERLTMGGASAVLMDAPAEQGENVTKFSRMARWLRRSGFSAPEIFAEDQTAGFLLLEDFGDALFARIMAQDPQQEEALYAAATDFLAALHQCRPPHFLTPLDAAALGDLVRLTLKWYLPGAGGGNNLLAASIPAMIETNFVRLRFCDPVVSVRDFHAENLIWLPHRNGLARVGLLDFQDAVLTDPAYDLVSLLQDARRDVCPAIEASMISRYCAQRALPIDRLMAVYALLGAQRALRIVGIFARLSMHFAKPHYMDYVPRVWGYLERNLTHPELTPLADAVRGGLPGPTPERLKRIKDLCGSVPTL